MRHQYSGGEGDTRFRPTCIYASLKHAARKLHFTRLPIVFFFWKRLVRNERERVWNIVAESRGKFLSINLYEFNILNILIIYFTRGVELNNNNNN